MNRNNYSRESAVVARALSTRSNKQRMKSRQDINEGKKIRVNINIPEQLLNERKESLRNKRMNESILARPKQDKDGLSKEFFRAKQVLESAGIKNYSLYPDGTVKFKAVNESVSTVSKKSDELSPEFYKSMRLVESAGIKKYAIHMDGSVELNGKVIDASKVRNVINESKVVKNSVSLSPKFFKSKQLLESAGVKKYAIYPDGSVEIDGKVIDASKVRGFINENMYISRGKKINESEDYEDINERKDEDLEPEELEPEADEEGAEEAEAELCDLVIYVDNMEDAIAELSDYEVDAEVYTEEGAEVPEELDEPGKLIVRVEQMEGLVKFLESKGFSIEDLFEEEPEEDLEPEEEPEEDLEPEEEPEE